MLKWKKKTHLVISVKHLDHKVQLSCIFNFWIYKFQSIFVLSADRSSDEISKPIYYNLCSANYSCM